MKITAKHQLQMLQTGVPGLDTVIGGGLPELSFNLIAGGPGSGKTTMAMQILFANATRKRPGLYLTILGEPSLKLLRYQQQFGFFDVHRIGSDVHFINLSEDALTQDLERVMARIVVEVDRHHPGVVVIDSFRSLARSQSGAPSADVQMEQFIQRLALHLTSWEVTSFLVGEYEPAELHSPVFTVADGILWLVQAVDRNSMVRKLQVVKMRGAPMMPGLHTLRINSQGMQIFPRMLLTRPQGVRAKETPRQSTGIRALDEMMGGGIPGGDSLVIAGPTGTGKTTVVTQFVADGIREGEGAVIAIFEEHPTEYMDRARGFGMDFEAAVKKNLLRIIYVRPLDLSVDETLSEIGDAVREIKATRVVIDSISGFEMALAPTFREDFRESLYRLVSALTAMGVTVVLTVEVMDGEAGLRFTNYGVSFLTDDIIVQRYAEIEGQLRKVMLVVKMRGSKHSRDFRSYEITGKGIVMGDLLREYDGIITGSPTLKSRIQQPRYPGLSEEEMLALETIIRNPGQDIAALVHRTGLPEGDLQPILDRLVKLDYARSGSHKGGNQYHGVARLNGS